MDRTKVQDYYNYTDKHILHKYALHLLQQRAVCWEFRILLHGQAGNVVTLTVSEFPENATQEEEDGVFVSHDMVLVFRRAEGRGLSWEVERK